MEYGGEDGSGGIFSLGRRARGTNVGVGSMLTGVSLGRALTETEIGTGVQIPEPVNPTLDAYSPYGAAWKEFDNLQKTAKGRGLLSSTHSWLAFVPGIVSLFDPHKGARPYERGVFVATLVFALAAVVRSRWAASRLAHWPCPRCHSEWPGNKSEKDPRCAVCGLKLHQLTP